MNVDGTLFATSLNAEGRDVSTVTWDSCLSSCFSDKSITIF